MNQANQIRNLLEFTAIFLSGDLKLTKQSTDYYREKYDKYIGFPIKHHAETTNNYLEWSKIWGEDKDINTLFLYFKDIFELFKQKERNGLLIDYKEEFWTDEVHWMLNIAPDELMSIFKKRIGDPDQIKSTRRSWVHPIVKQKILDRYIEINSRYFKFLRILNDENNF